MTTTELETHLEFKAVPVGGVRVLDEAKGIVEAIVSVTGIVDEVKDVIEPGAYEKTLAKRTPKGVWSHAWDKPISKTLEAKELMPGDARLPKQTRGGRPWPREAGALMVKMQFNLNTERGRDAYEDVKFFGDDAEWSVGYQVPMAGAQVEQKSGVRRIKTMELYEYSPVLFGAMPMAVTQSVKSAQLAYKSLVDAEGKARHVRTPEGARAYGKPIGSPLGGSKMPAGTRLISQLEPGDAIQGKHDPEPRVVEEVTRNRSTGGWRIVYEDGAEQEFDATFRGTFKVSAEEKARVRTAEGAARFNVPIGSLIDRSTRLAYPRTLKEEARRLGFSVQGGESITVKNADEALDRLAKAAAAAQQESMNAFDSKKAKKAGDRASVLRAMHRALGRALGMKALDHDELEEKGKAPPTKHPFVSKQGDMGKCDICGDSKDDHNKTMGKKSAVPGEDAEEDAGLDEPLTDEEADEVVELLVEDGVDLDDDLTHEEKVALRLVDLEHKDVPEGGSAESLRRYWTVGKGALKIKWGVEGDFKRCVRLLAKYMPGRAEGYCSNLHVRAVGERPGQGPHAGKGLEDDIETVYVSVETKSADLVDRVGEAVGVPLTSAQAERLARAFDEVKAALADVGLPQEDDEDDTDALRDDELMRAQALRLHAV